MAEGACANPTMAFESHEGVKHQEGRRPVNVRA